MSFSIPYAVLASETSPKKTQLLNAVEKVLDSGRYILGPEVKKFEEEFANFCESKYSGGVASGTCALHLVLRALNLKKGDEVITAPNSFIASASSIALVGAKPVFADIRDDGNIDPKKIEEAITDKTKVIMPVHLTGRPARMPEIMSIAKKYSLSVVEDAAQAVGAKIKGRSVGSWGDAACFSLHPLKNLHAFGDGGMVTSNHIDLINLLYKSRNHGLENREQCDFWAHNCRLDEIHASMLRVQLRELKKVNAKRREVALTYNSLLKDFVDVPFEGDDEYCVYQTYVIKCRSRDNLQQFLRQNGVEALVHYKTPLFDQPAANYLGNNAKQFPQTTKHCDSILSLPLYPSLKIEQQEKVADLISKFYKTN